MKSSDGFLLPKVPRIDPIDLTINSSDMVAKSVLNRSLKSNNAGPLEHSRTPCRIEKEFGWTVSGRVGNETDL